MYPESSKIDKIKNKIPIMGIKARIPPTPPMIPSMINELIQCGEWIDSKNIDISLPKKSKKSYISDINGLESPNVA